MDSIQTRFQASKRLLTGGTRLENDPRVQGLSKQLWRYGQVQSYVRPTDAVHIHTGTVVMTQAEWGMRVGSFAPVREHPFASRFLVRCRRERASR